MCQEVDQPHVELGEKRVAVDEEVVVARKPIKLFDNRVESLVLLLRVETRIGRSPQRILQVQHTCRARCLHELLGRAENPQKISENHTENSEQN